jgi:hypothetical protein
MIKIYIFLNSLNRNQSARRHFLFYFSKDVFALDQIVKRIESYRGIKNIDFYIPISMEFHKEIVIKEIERIVINKEEQRFWTKEVSNVVT